MAFKLENNSTLYLNATHGEGDPKIQYGFVYRKPDDELIYLHYCKELACFNAQPDQVMFKLKVSDNLERFLNTFKKLDSWYGFNTPVEVLQHQDGPIISITGDHWYFSHKIAYEVLAIMLKECYDREIESLDDFVRNNRYSKAGYSFKTTEGLIKILQNPVGILAAAKKHNYDFSAMENHMEGHFSYGLLSCLYYGYLDCLTDLPLDS